VQAGAVAVGDDDITLSVTIDIEGAELAALQGAESFLSLPAGRAPNILFEVHRHYVDWSEGLELDLETRHERENPARIPPAGETLRRHSGD
jgi:hypothetical protein